MSVLSERRKDYRILYYVDHDGADYLPHHDCLWGKETGNMIARKRCGHAGNARYCA